METDHTEKSNSFLGYHGLSTVMQKNNASQAAQLCCKSAAIRLLSEGWNNNIVVLYCHLHP